MRDALIACINELEAFDPEDQSTIDYANKILGEYGTWYQLQKGMTDA